MGTSRGLWALVALGLAAALFPLSSRWALEAGNRLAEPVLDYASVVQLSRAGGRPVPALLEEFRRYGVVSLALSEQPLEDLVAAGEVRLLSSLELEGALRSGELTASGLPRPGRLYLYCPEASTRQRLEEALRLALGGERVRGWSGDLLELAVDPQVLEGLTLGFPPGLVESLRAAGFRLWLRPENHLRTDPETVRRRVERWARLGPVEGLVFAGPRNEAVGYPDGLEAMARGLERHAWKLGVVEAPPQNLQKGVERLARQLPGQAVRVQSVHPLHQARVPPERLVGMYSLGCRERNIRVLYLRPYTEPTLGKTPEQLNRALFAGLKEELGDRFGPAGTFAAPSSGALLPVALAAAAAGAAAWLLVLYAFPVSPRGGGWAAGLVLALTLLAEFLGWGQQWRTLAALGTACVFATLALVSQLSSLEAVALRPPLGGTLVGAGVILVRATAVSLAGGLLVAALLHEPTFLLALDTFRGVKLVSLGVPLAVVLFYLGRREQFRYVADTPVKLWHAAGLALLAVVAVFYLQRTGNVAGGGLLELEKALRQALDQFLGVRPRFKEFALGHPALILAAVLPRLGWHRAVWLALLAAGVAQASVVDTFAHLHTPLAVSLARTFLGLGLGGALGTAAACLLVAGVRRFRDWQEPA